jgi:hypothetical protein
MTFIFDRYHVDTVDEPDIEEASDGEYVLAEDAINREAVNADRIRLLEVQLKEAKAALASNKAAAVAAEPVGYLHTFANPERPHDPIKRFSTYRFQKPHTCDETVIECVPLYATLPAPIVSADDFPYQRTFDAIAAATKIEAGHIAISVRAFAEAYNAESPAPIASAEEAVPVAEIVLFGGDVKEVAWTKGKMPEVGTKLYTHPAAEQPSRAEDK